MIETEVLLWIWVIGFSIVFIREFLDSVSEKDPEITIFHGALCGLFIGIFWPIALMFWAVELVMNIIKRGL